MSLPFSSLRAIHSDTLYPSAFPFQMASSGASVPATAATSLLTIVPMDDDGNIRNISRPQTAGGTGTGAETSVAIGMQGGGLDADSKKTEDPEGGKEASSSPSTNPLEQIALTFLLVTGRRKTMTFDLNATIGRAKELVWNAWPSGESGEIVRLFVVVNIFFVLQRPSEWAEDRPPAPNYLRILYNGRILQDDDTLSSAYDVFTTSHDSSVSLSRFRRTNVPQSWH